MAQLLIDSHHEVEATVLSLLLSDIGLLSTKQGVFNALSGLRKQDELGSFTQEEKAVLLERSFDLDGHLLALAFNECSQFNCRTEALTLIYEVQDKSLS